MAEMGFMERQLRVPIDGPLGPWVSVYLDSLEGEARALSTRYETWRELRRLAEEYPDRDAADLTTIDLERFMAIRCTGRSPATRKKVLAIVGGFTGYLHDRGVIPTNPARPIRRPTIPDPEPTFWTPAEVRAILAAPMQPRDHVLLETLARTGQRVGVVRTLRWHQVKPDARTPVIDFARGKGGRVFSVPMDKELIHDFITLRRLTHPEPDGWVFQSRNRHSRGLDATGLNGPISCQQVNRIIEEACRKAGVRVASAHEFRRSCVTNLLHAGVPLDVVSRDIAGHRSPETTMKHYRGSESARVREALRGLPY
jgi:integrase/recombinase XerC